MGVPGTARLIKEQYFNSHMPPYPPKLTQRRAVKTKKGSSQIVSAKKKKKTKNKTKQNIYIYIHKMFNYILDI